MDYLLRNKKAVTVRESRPEDAEEFIELIQKADIETRFLAREAGEFDLTVEETRNFIMSMKNSEDRALLVAEYDGKVIGQCSVSLIRGYKRYRHRAEAAFAIAKEYCNLGIGGKMMEACLEWCKSHKVSQLELDVVTANTRAFEMYRGFGFEITGKTPNALHYSDGTFADEYRMIKSILQ